MFGQQNGGAMSGPMMMLKSLGFDPGAIMGQIESAKVSCNEVLAHFDMRLKTIEQQQAQILIALEFLMKQDDKVQ